VIEWSPSPASKRHNADAVSSGPSRTARFTMAGPVCAHHWRSGSVSVAEPEPSAKAGEDSTAKTAETVDWKASDAGSRSENKEGRRGVTSL
jgi:hypothetical protein